MKGECKRLTAGESIQGQFHSTTFKLPFLHPTRTLPRDDVPPVVTRTAPERDDSFQQQGGLKNKYGDVWK